MNIAARLRNIVVKNWRDMSYLNVPRLVYAILSLVTLPLVLQNVPVDEYGGLQLVLAIQAWIIILSGSQISSAAKRGIVIKLEGTFLYGFFARLKLLLPLALVYFLGGIYVYINGYEFFSILTIIASLNLLFIHPFESSLFEYLIAKKNYSAWSRYQIINSSLSLLIATGVILYTKTIIFYFLTQSIILVLASVIEWLLIVQKEGLIKKYQIGAIDKECIVYGKKFIFVDIITATADKLAYVFIGYFLGLGDLALFAVAYKLRDHFAGFIKSLQPALYTDFASQRADIVLARLKDRFLILFLLSTGAAALFFLIGSGYILFFLPKSVHQTILYFGILLMSFPIGGISIALHTYLESHLKYKELLIMAVWPNLITIFSILLLGYYGGIIGVCIALAVETWICAIFYYALTLLKLPKH